MQLINRNICENFNQLTYIVSFYDQHHIEESIWEEQKEHLVKSNVIIILKEDSYAVY